MNDPNAITQGELLLPAVQNPVQYEVLVPHPLSTILALAVILAGAALLVWGLDQYDKARGRGKHFYPDLPDPDYSTKREIEKAHKMAVYSARIRRQS